MACRRAERKRPARNPSCGKRFACRARAAIEPAMIPDRLFVYGTLMRGYDHPMAKLLAANADFLGSAACAGRLYLVKHYPGLVLSDDPAELVHGDLFRLRARDELLRELDIYEACGDGFPEPTEYVRRMITVALEGGESSKAWTYVYNWPVTDLPRISSGRFCTA